MDSAQHFLTDFLGVGILWAFKSSGQWMSVGNLYTVDKLSTEVCYGHSRARGQWMSVGNYLIVGNSYTVDKLSTV